MTSTYRHLARFVVAMLLFGVLPAMQSQPAAAQDTASYTAIKYDCNAGYDPASGDANAAFANCTTPAAGVSFTLQGGGGYGGTQQTDTGGTTSWSGIPLGSGYSVSESVQQGYGTPWVYCEVSGDPNNPNDVQRSFFAASGGNMDVGYSDPSLTSYTQATCYWFNTPPSEQNGQTYNGLTGNATVHITKYLCEPGYDYQAGDANVLDDCQSPHANVKFTVNGGNPVTTGSDGVAQFGSLPAGQAQIRLIEVTGYIPIVIACLDWDNSQSGTPNPQNASKLTWQDEGNGSYLITGDLTDNHTYYCYAFDLPDAHPNVYIYKYYCEPDFDWQSNGYDYLLSGCTTPHENVYFEINAGMYSQGQTTNSSGTASWSNVPFGQLAITETVPSGYQVGRIFCGVAQQNDATQPTTWTEYTYADGWNVELPEGQYLHCYVFDIPADYGTLYLYKLYCPPEFDWQGGGYDYLLAGCTTPHEDVYFEVHNGSYSQGETTDTGGIAIWNNVPSGTLDIVETPPDGYQVGRVFCGYSPNGQDLPTSWDEYTYEQAIQVEMQSGQYLFCVFYDVPTTDHGTIYLYKYYCGPDFDWENGSYDYLLSGCPDPQPDVMFHGTSGSYSQDQTTDTAGYATWTGVPSGDFGFLEEPPEGYTVGRIFCGYSDTEGTPPTSWDEYSYTDGWSVPYESDQYLYCYVFDIPYDNGTVYFYKYYCEPDFDWQSNGYDYLLSGCTTPHENVYFELYSGSYTEGQTTDTAGAATWSDVPWGDLSFYEEIPDGYQVGRIFCGYSETEGTQPTSWDEYSYSDGWDVPTPPGKYLYCYVFDVPYDYGTVYVYKYYCEPDFDWESNGYDYLLSGCTNPHANIDFEIHNGSYSEGQTTDSSGLAAWEDVVPGGPLDIVVFEAEGYQVGRIFCGVTEQNSGSQPTTWQEYFYSDGWQVELPHGQYLHCYVFDVPYDYGTIYIYKYYCEPDFDWNGGGYDYLLSGCTTPHEGVPFEVSNLAYAQSQTTDNTGLATWQDVPPGDYRVIEDVPDGYQVGRVFCGYSEEEGVPPSTWDEYFYDQWYDVEVQDGWYLSCYVFDVPYDYGTVYVYKYYCDPEFDWQSNGYDYLLSECDSWQPDVYFEIESGGYVSGQTTDTNGTATWDDVPVGPLKIWEQPPDGYQVGRIFCGVVAQNSGTQPTTWDEYDYTDAWYVDLPEGQYLHCYVFDVPTEYGWVNVWKYNCPQDFDYASTELSYYESTCTERPEGVDFDLYNQPYGYEESQSTDSGGEAGWSDVPSGGELYFWEVPNGYTPIAVWCGVSSDGSEPSTWDEYTLDSDGALSGIWVEPNQYLYCKWFNKPYDNPQVWIYKYNCEQTAHWSWTYHQLLSSCTTWAPDVEFGWGAQGEEPSSSTTDDQGKWLYEDLSPGIWYWEESFPSGYDGAVVYCQWVGAYGSGDYQKADLDGSTLWLDIDYGDVVTCYWFDFPTGYGPPAQPPASGDSGGSSGSGGSGSSGGTGGTGSAGGGTGGPPPLTSNAPTGPVSGGPVGGSTTQTPGNPNAPATLILVKHTCAEGFDLYAEDADVEQDCTELTADIDFALTDLATADAEPVDQTTGDDGKATWTNLKAGPYLIVETLPEDTYSAFIWTCKSDKRQFQIEYPFTPFSYAGPNGEIGITLIAGEKLECAWYNVPAAAAEVTVLKFECPGSPVIVAQCTPAGAGVAFNLTPTGGAVGAIIQLTTDDSGSASGSGAEGAYSVAEDGGSPCLIDSESLDEQGNVVLVAGTPAEVRIYNCGGGGS